MRRAENGITVKCQVTLVSKMKRRRKKKKKGNLMFRIELSGSSWGAELVLPEQAAEGWGAADNERQV